MLSKNSVKLKICHQASRDVREFRRMSIGEMLCQQISKKLDQVLHVQVSFLSILLTKNYPLGSRSFPSSSFSTASLSDDSTACCKARMREAILSPSLTNIIYITHFYLDQIQRNFLLKSHNSCEYKFLQLFFFNFE